MKLCSAMCLVCLTESLGVRGGLAGKSIGCTNKDLPSWGAISEVDHSSAHGKFRLD